MAHEFRLPDIGEGLTEAEIVRWLVAEGAEVASDQPVVEVETDKAVVEIPSPYAGVVVRHGGAEGDVIAVGDVLVVIGDAAEESPPPASTGPPMATTPPEAVFAPSTEPAVEFTVAPDEPIVGTLNEDAELIESAPETVVAETPQVKALPIVRKLARETGVDLETVSGTGPGGRITREDVEAAASSSSDRASDVAPSVVPEIEQPTKVGPASEPPEVTRRMSRLRRTIAANMSRSWAEIPHVTTFDDIDATRLLEVKTALSDRHGMKIPIEALVIRAVLPALVAYPEFNSTLDGDDLVTHESLDIGIAVDTPEGLMVAVIDDAGSKSVIDLAAEVRRLGEGAKERTLLPGELTGQTFTVSNIGAVGGGHGTPIVPYGTTAILSIGRAQPKPMVYENDLVIAQVMPLSLSYDHRVIDGGLGRRFMGLLMENLEEPALFLAG